MTGDLDLLDLLLVVSVLSVAVGAGLIFLPAGLIAGGTLGIAGVIFYARGARDRQDDRPRP